MDEHCHEIRMFMHKVLFPQLLKIISVESLVFFPFSSSFSRCSTTWCALSRRSGRNCKR